MEHIWGDLLIAIFAMSLVCMFVWLIMKTYQRINRAYKYKPTKNINYDYERINPCYLYKINTRVTKHNIYKPKRNHARNSKR